MYLYSNIDFNIKKFGSFYHENKTIFRVFAPRSKAISLIIHNHEYIMHQNGLCFEIALGGNLENIKYHYVNDEGISFLDPFAYYSDEKDSYVLDTKKFNKDVIVPKTNKNTVIYETSVRDFSSDISYSGHYRGKFLSFTELGLKNEGFSIGLDYLKELNVSHIQLMPVFDFDSDGSEYNWGYNPIAYNYVKRDYVYEQGNPYAYINELREVINAIHANDLRVTLDVVFNHVYDPENNDLIKMLKGGIRYKEDGQLAKGTGCGNEIDSEDPFIRAYIVEMVSRYIELFDIDGIRLDLMGILDIDTVNLIKSSTKKLKDDFLVYGEGWNMGDVLSEDKRATIENADKLPSIGMFNDTYKSTIIKYVCGDNSIYEDITEALSSTSNELNHHQSINYVECHDDYTFFDRLLVYKDEGEINNIKRCKLALGLVMLSRGIPFIHSGQEFLRTKNKEDNSYNASADINKLDWNLRVKYNEVSSYLKSLIEFRNEHSCFNNDNVDVSFSDYYGCLIYRIYNLCIFINNTEYDYDYREVGNYNVIFDSNGKCNYVGQTLTIPALSLIVFKVL